MPRIAKPYGTQGRERRSGNQSKVLQTMCWQTRRRRLLGRSSGGLADQVLPPPTSMELVVSPPPPLLPMSSFPTRPTSSRTYACTLAALRSPPNNFTPSLSPPPLFLACPLVPSLDGVSNSTSTSSCGYSEQAHVLWWSSNGLPRTRTPTLFLPRTSHRNVLLQR